MKKSGYVILLLVVMAISMMIGVYVGKQQNGGQIEIGWNSIEPPMVNLNTATIDELTEIPGIGELTAQRILEYRDRIGHFKTVEELLNISGISSDKLNEIREYLRVK